MFNRKEKKVLERKFVLKVMFMTDLLFDFYSAKLGLTSAELNLKKASLSK